MDPSALEARLEARIDALATALAENVDRPELADMKLDWFESMLRSEISAIGALAIPASLPERDAYYARFLAQIGEPVSNLIWGYQAAHRALWDAVGDRDLSDFLFDYAARMSERAVEEFTLERERLARGWQRRKANIIHELLGERDVDPAPLDYELNAAHVAIIGWGTDVEAAIKEIAGQSGWRLLLISLPELEASWGWFGSMTSVDLHDRLRVPGGVHLAVGEQGLGLEGFRRSHWQAGHAFRAGSKSGRQITHFSDVALEVLAARDGAEARAFVERELSDLGAEGTRAARLRETLLAYFASGHNAAAAAATLGVHEQTIANRITTVEQLLGVDVTARRAELETALRLRSYLG